MQYASESGGVWYIVIETSFHYNIYNGSVWCPPKKLDYETNCWLWHVVAYLLIAMATLTSLAARTLASMSSMMMVTSFNSLSGMGMESRSSVDQMVCGYMCVV